MKFHCDWVTRKNDKTMKIKVMVGKELDKKFNSALKEFHDFFENFSLKS